MTDTEDRSILTVKHPVTVWARLKVQSLVNWPSCLEYGYRAEGSGPTSIMKFLQNG